MTSGPESRQARIERRAREFELGALLRLLGEEGYGHEDILLESNAESQAAAGVVEAVRFQENPRRVSVLVNMGLLGDQSLLPSYFQEIVERARDPQPFFDFIRFFDHALLENHARAVAPEEDERMYTDWSATKRSYFQMLGPGSVSTLAWLFQLYFPELRSSVSRHAFQSASARHALRAGHSRLDGTAVVGRVYDATTPGFSVDLCAEYEADGVGVAWPHVVRERLSRHLLPLLAPARVPLTVNLVVLSHASWARLSRTGFLGYERLAGDATAPHRILLFQGNTGDAGTAAAAGETP